MASQQMKAKGPMLEEKYVDKVDRLDYHPQLQRCSSQEKENNIYTCKKSNVQACLDNILV